MAVVGQGLPSLLTTASGVCGSEPPARWSPAERPVLAAKRPFLLGRIGEEDRTEPPDAATANGRFCFGCQPIVTYPPVVMRRVREPPEREPAGGWVGCLVRLLSYRAFCRVALPNATPFGGDRLGPLVLPRAFCVGPAARGCPYPASRGTPLPSPSPESWFHLWTPRSRQGKTSGLLLRVVGCCHLSGLWCSDGVLPACRGSSRTGSRSRGRA
jgi:hypothetical protein